MRRRPSRRPLLALAGAALLALSVTATTSPAGAGGRPGTGGRPVAARTAAHPALPPVGHVWLVVLENKSYAQSFGTMSQAPYLRQLAGRGALLEQYYGTAHFSLPNYLALLSGQGPNLATQGDCQTYTDFVAAGPAQADGQLPGQGCVYPKRTPMLADELEARHRTWKAYLEDLGASTSRQVLPCGTPRTDALGRDLSQTAAAGDQYAARHNPFAYFHSVTDDPARCRTHVAPLPAMLRDLRRASTTPALNVVVPNLCNDGHDTPCVGRDTAGSSAGNLTAVQHWLSRYVPAILRSPAFGKDGLLLVTWDEAAATTGADGSADSSACCQERVLNTPDAGGASSDISGLRSLSGRGGGRVGLIAVSPYVRPGTVSRVAYNHYSALRTLSDLFRVPRPGYANQASGVVSFGRDVFTNPGGPAKRRPAQRRVSRRAGLPRTG